jgi:hypothetical protein
VTLSKQEWLEKNLGEEGKRVSLIINRLSEKIEDAQLLPISDEIPTDLAPKEKYIISSNFEKLGWIVLFPKGDKYQAWIELH